MGALLLALGVLTAADAATTCHNLKRPGMVETNQFLGQHPSCRSVIVAKVASSGATTLVGLGLRPKRAAKWTVVFVTSYNGFNVGWNIYQSRR